MSIEKLANEYKTTGRPIKLGRDRINKRVVRSGTCGHEQPLQWLVKKAGK